MKREEFERALSLSKMNVGQIESLRKFFSLQHDIMQQQVVALNKLLNDKENPLDSEKRAQADKTVEQLFLIMFSLEYKATLLYERAKKLLKGS